MDHAIINSVNATTTARKLFLLTTFLLYACNGSSPEVATQITADQPLADAEIAEVIDLPPTIPSTAIIEPSAEPEPTPTAEPDTPDAIYVATNGSDESGTGSIEQPFGSIQRAITQQQSMRAQQIIRDVVLRGGTYRLDESVALDAKHSGTAENPVVVRAHSGETPVLSGAQHLSAHCTKLAHDDPLAQRIGAAALEHTWSCTAALPSTKTPALARDAHTPSYPQLIVNEQAQQLARHPNQGFANITGSHELSFSYDDPAFHRLATESNARIDGYLQWFWRYQMQKIAHVDSGADSITLAHNNEKEIRTGKRFRAVNGLSLLDTPGEFFIDWAQQRILLHRSDDTPITKIELSWLGHDQEPLIHIQNAQHIQIHGLQLQDGRWHGIQVNDSKDILLSNLHVQRMGHWGVHVMGGARVGVVNSRVHHVGRGGLYLLGGDRTTLTVAQHFALNNHIHHYAQLVPTYRHAVYLYGVGNIAAYNHIHDAPHVAIQFEGNEHRVELNHIHDVVQFSDDASAIYAYYDASAFGTKVRWNQVHHIASRAPQKIGIRGLYLDGGYGPIHIYGNIFSDIRGSGIFLNKGHFNTANNNIFVRTQTAILSTSGPMSEGQRAKHYRDARDFAEHPAWSKYAPLITQYPEEGASPYFDFFRRIVGTQVHTNIMVDVARDFRTASPQDSLFSQSRFVHHGNQTLPTSDLVDPNVLAKGIHSSEAMNNMSNWRTLPWDVLQDRYRARGVDPQWDITRGSNPQEILQRYNALIDTFAYSPAGIVDAQKLFEAQ